MSEPKRPLKVFLCHAHADRDPVRGLYTRLTQDGVDAWLDKAKLLPGQDWELEIRKAVREADVVVVCLSKQFNQAGFRQKEVRLALDTAMEKPEGEIFIIPARLEECDNLESLRKWHWVDLYEDDGYEMLMRAFRARANRIGATLQVKRSWLSKINTQSEAATNTSLPTDKPQKKKTLVPKSKKEFQARKNFNRNIIGMLGFLVLALVSIFGLPSFFNRPVEYSAETNTKSVDITVSKTPSPSPLPSHTSSPVSFPTSVSLVGLAGEWKSLDTTCAIIWENDKYIVASCINSERSTYPIVEQSWSEGQLTWKYYVEEYDNYVTYTTIGLNENILQTSWVNTIGSTPDTIDWVRVH